MDAAGFSFESIAAWLYLAVFGSLVGFTAYAWLLRNAPISKVVTHQYVNPLVAIVLGALLLDEQLTLAVGARRGADRRLGLRRRAAGERRRQAPARPRARRSRLGLAVRRGTAGAGVRGVALEIVHEAGLGLDPPQPGLDGRVVRELDAGVAGDVRVCVEPDVRDGVARCRAGTRSPPAAARARRASAGRPSASARRAPRGPSARPVRIQKRPVPMFGSSRFCSKKSHCAARDRPSLSVRQERRPLGQVEQDRARLGEMLAGVELEHRRPAGRVAREVLRCLRLAGEEVDRHELELEAQLRRGSRTL